MRRKGFFFIFKAQDDLRTAFLVQFGAFCGAVWGILWYSLGHFVVQFGHFVVQFGAFCGAFFDSYSYF